MTELIALIDLDGTLVNYDKGLQEGLNKLKSEEETSEYLEYLPHHKARRNIIRNTPGFWENLEALDIGFRVLGHLEAQEFTPYILSKVPRSSPNAWLEKYNWCQKYVPEIKITLTEEKTHVFGHILFDDFPEYVEPWLKFNKNSFCIMLEHPWNKDFIHERVLKVDIENYDFRAVGEFILKVKENFIK